MTLVEAPYGVGGSEWLTKKRLLGALALIQIPTEVCFGGLGGRLAIIAAPSCWVA